MTEIVPGTVFQSPIEMPSRRVRRTIVSVTMALCWVVIIGILSYGDSMNSLHVSALAWAFTLNGATLFAYVFGSVVDYFNVTKQ